MCDNLLTGVMNFYFLEYRLEVKVSHFQRKEVYFSKYMCAVSVQFIQNQDYVDFYIEFLKHAIFISVLLAYMIENSKAIIDTSQTMQITMYTSVDIRTNSRRSNLVFQVKLG